MSDLETRKLIRGVIAQGGLPLDVLLASLRGLPLESLTTLGIAVAMERGTFNNWGNKRKKTRVRDLDDDHLCAIWKGYSGEVNRYIGVPGQKTKKKFIGHEMKKRGLLSEPTE